MPSYNDGKAVKYTTWTKVEIAPFISRMIRVEPMPFREYPKISGA